MRVAPNRQIVSSTSRWNLQQMDVESPGAQKAALPNRATGQGSRLVQLKQSLANAQAHLAQCTDPRLIQNLTHGITLLQAQIARISGVDHKDFDIHTIPENVTGYKFPGWAEGTDFDQTAIDDQSHTAGKMVLSPFATFQLAGTLRQKITKVPLPPNATPAGSLKTNGVDPSTRSNVIRTPNNPAGSTFPTGIPGPDAAMNKSADHRNQDYRGRLYLQGFTPGTHTLDVTWNAQNGVIPSDQPARGKHGQFLSGYKWIGATTEEGSFSDKSEIPLA